VVTSSTGTEDKSGNLSFFRVRIKRKEVVLKRLFVSLIVIGILAVVSGCTKGITYVNEPNINNCLPSGGRAADEGLSGSAFFTADKKFK
jgi:hypothetical protein